MSAVTVAEPLSNLNDVGTKPTLSKVIPNLIVNGKDKRELHGGVFKREHHDRVGAVKIALFSSARSKFSSKLLFPSVFRLSSF